MQVFIAIYFCRLCHLGVSICRYLIQVEREGTAAHVIKYKFYESVMLIKPNAVHVKCCSSCSSERKIRKEKKEKKEKKERKEREKKQSMLPDEKPSK
jgi:hypothetical protein